METHKTIHLWIGAQSSTARKLADLCGSEFSTARKLADLCGSEFSAARKLADLCGSELRAAQVGNLLIFVDWSSAQRRSEASQWLFSQGLEASQWLAGSGGSQQW